MTDTDRVKLNLLFSRAFIFLLTEGVDDEDREEPDLSVDEENKVSNIVESFLAHQCEGFFSDVSDREEWNVLVSTWLHNLTTNEKLREWASALLNYEDIIEMLVDGLFVQFTLPSLTTSFSPQDRVMALLSIDQEFHPGVVVQALSKDENSMNEQEEVYLIKFTEFGGGVVEKVSLRDLSLDDSIRLENDDDDESIGSNFLSAEGPTERRGVCRICERNVLRTFHHLVPRHTHNKISKRKRGLLAPKVEEVYLTHNPKGKTRWDWLQTHGIMICGKCHRFVHRTENNMTLALQYNTLDKLLRHPELRKWRSYMITQKEITKFDGRCFEIA